MVTKPHLIKQLKTFNIEHLYDVIRNQKGVT